MNNLELMKKRLEWQGGIHQEDRMIKDKWRTLQRALLYSYQACSVQIVQPHNFVLDMNDPIDPEMSIFQEVRALINPDKVKQDYDDKIISIDYVHGYKPGDVFEWKKTDTYWIIYTQEITEDAYFRGEIRRCKYKIKFKDEEGEWCATWAAIRGPVETQINSIQKNQERIDVPNLSLNILMPYNEKILHAFDRYSEFLFAGRCWKVQAPDSISMVVKKDNQNYGVIEINAEEDYINRDTDDIDNEMKNGLVIEPIDPSPNSGIIGETFIKPKISEIYAVEQLDGTWSVDSKIPVTICPIDNKTVKVTWNKTTHGQFVLTWSNGVNTLEKTIVVESLY